ncbi:unnamed protein product [Closterium sp. NIES-54]
MGRYSGGGQMQLQRSQRESLPPQQLREWYASRSGGGGSSGKRCAAVKLGVSGDGLAQLQRRPRETLTPQQLREWYAQRGASRSSARCAYVIRTGARDGQTCRTNGHTQNRCFSCLRDNWRAKFGDAAELPRWLELLRQSVDIFSLDHDTILTTIYALPNGTKDDCSLRVLPDLGIEAAALGASESALPSTAPAEALHTFTLDSGASRCFFRDSTTLTPLTAPVPVRLADPSGGPVLARSSTVLPCPAVPLSGLHLPSFSTNLVSTAALQDAMVTTTTPGGQRVSICTCTRTGRHLATLTHRPGSSLYTLATEPPQVAASTQVSASGPVAPPFSCRLLSHQTLLWHHRLGHPSLLRLRGMHSRLLVSGLPMSLPPLPPSPALPCLPCVEGRQRAAPHSSSFPPTTAPLQTLHMDVWGPTRVSGQSRESYFLLVIEDYTRYTTVFPLRYKGQWEFFRGEGILQSFTLPASLQQNGIAERRIGFVMEVARTSMIHAAAPQFLWPFAVWYVAHQLNLWPHVSLPETSPTLRWTGEVGDVSVFWVWGSRAFVRDTSADKLSARAIPCVFIDFPPNAHGWQFYHPTSRRIFPSQDVTFDESVPFYHLFPYHSAPSPPPPLFLAPGPPPVDPLPPQGLAPSGVSQVDPLPCTVHVQVAVSSGAARGAASGGDASGGAEPGGAEFEGAGSGGDEHGGAEPRGAEPGGAEPTSAEPEGAAPKGVEPGGAESEGAEPQDTASSGGPAGTLPRLFPKPEPLFLQQLREWFDERTHLRSGTAGVGVSAAGDTGAGGVGVTAGAGGTRGAAAAAGGAGAGDPVDPGDAGGGGTGAGGAGAGGAGAGDTGSVGDEARGTGAGGAGTGGAGAGDSGTDDPRAGGAGAGGAVSGGTGAGGTPASPLPAPSPYTEQPGGLTEHREPESRPASPVRAVRTGRKVPRPRPPPVPGTHAIALRPSFVPLRVPLPPPYESPLPADPDPESDLDCAASPTISRFLAAVVTGPSFEATAASALLAELVD